MPAFTETAFQSGPLSAEQRLILRSRLEARMRALRGEISAATAVPDADETPHVPSAYGETDEPVADLQLTLDLSALMRDAGELAEVADALRRLDTTAFGTCPDCGEPIGWPRLSALPHVRRCARCASFAERKSSVAAAARL